MASFKLRLSLVVLLAVVPAVATDRAAEIERLKPVAEKGEAAAQYQLGLLYAEGKDLPEAAHYYKLAAEQDHHEAQARLALLNCNGTGVPKNAEECVRLLKLAAEAGVTLAEVNLAQHYLTGDGASINHREAARLARLAADKGDPTGQFLLGICYETGVGVGENRSEAVRLYRLAAAKGNTGAQKGLARLGEAAQPASSSPEADARPQSSAAITSRTVTLRRRGGVLTVPAVLNDSVSADFVVDSGASDVVLPEGVLDELRSAGKFSDADFTGAQMVKIANGSIVKARTFTLRSLAIGNRVVTNLHASVAPAKATPLLGQTFLQRFASWSIDNERQVLVLKEKDAITR
ncbi:MAG TPA: retroviral-like aspartic protease family protein [Reyranella sp.]|nr:retroviral-like aspartic protease family protein [Reyranella sp.]